MALYISSIILNSFDDVIQKYCEKDQELTDDIINLYYDIFVESSKNTEITHPNYENGISSAVFTLLVYVSMVTKDELL